MNRKLATHKCTKALCFRYVQQPLQNYVKDAALCFEPMTTSLPQGSERYANICAPICQVPVCGFPGKISHADGRTCIMLIWWPRGWRKSPRFRCSLQSNWVHLSVSPKKGTDVVIRWLSLFACVPAPCVHVCGTKLKSLLTPRGLRGCARLLSHSYRNQVSGSMRINDDSSHHS